jgi:hypothetical protein
MSLLTITARDKNEYYSLYADGPYLEKKYIKYTGTTKLVYGDNAVIFLYYKYPAYRQACAVRNAEGAASLPGLSKKVNQIFSLSASRVDRLKKAAEFLDRNCGSAYNFSDAFYIRLYYLLLKRKTLTGPELLSLADRGFSKARSAADTKADFFSFAVF